MIYVNILDTETINKIDKCKHSRLIFDDNIILCEYIKQLPYYVSEIYYVGSNEDIKHYIRLQMPNEINGLYARPKFRIDLDVTTKCNLSCNNCNKLSNFKSTWATMTDESIDTFISNVKDKDIQVKIVGGEPTLLPNLDDIILKLHKANINMILLTNGIIKYSPPIDIAIEDSAKYPGIRPGFHTTMVAPIDQPEFEGIDYSLGCTQLYDCGMGYKDDKFYACGVGAHLNKLLPINDYGRDTLEEAYLDKEFLSNICKYCGLFKKLGFHNRDKTKWEREDIQLFSESWKFMEDRK